MTGRFARLVVFGAALGLASLGSAQTLATPSAADAPLPWTSLNASERQVLEPLHKHWDALPPGLQHRWRARADRWQTLTPGRRADLRRHFERWNRISPQQRAELRQRYLQFQQLPPDQRRRIRRAFRHFRNLPPDERRRLRDKFEHMTPQQRQAALADMGGHDEHAHPGEAIRTLSPAQRLGAMRLWRELPPAQRRAFLRKLRDTPPSQRAGYLRHLSNMSASERTVELGSRDGDPPR